VKRREFLSTGLAAASSAALLSRVAFARASKASPARFVFIILRGALDGLTSVPPYGDPGYVALRRDLALHAPGSPGGVAPLDALFGLHPALKFLEEEYAARELIVLHAVASPYRDRSHFDGQDVLESGFVKPHAVQTGWLNRALAALPGHASEQERGVALGQNIPLVMRGPAAVSSWSPSKLASLDAETLERITELYANDPLLSRLMEAVSAEAIAKESGDGPGEDAGGKMGASAEGAPGMSGPERPPSSVADTAATDARRAGRYGEVVRAAARFLRREDGPQVAVFDTTGWDTHANEGGAEGQLAGRLGVLDAGLQTLKAEMGPSWASTIVLLATEFGRTAAINGTRGTDHGTATAAFLLGGAVQGGRVIADWPGLSASDLYQGRDLKPTLDLRAVVKGVLREHLRIPEQALASSVFPDSAGVKALTGLVRA
jgi:uncharacterized protein (DUF1501 family)